MASARICLNSVDSEEKENMSHVTEPPKVAAKAILDALPDNASWDDVQYHLYVRQQVEAGLADEAAGRLVDTAEMRRRLAERQAQRKRGERRS
jgi:predicted transcriptional regulator